MSGTGVAPNYRCADCGFALCGCLDVAWIGVATVDDRSEPGAWARHIRDTACMRDHGPAPFTNTRPTTSAGDRDGAGSAQPASDVNAVSGSGFALAAKAGPVATSEARA